jgi:hypothetical protein
MLEHYLSSKNEMCYKNFSPNFLRTEHGHTQNFSYSTRHIESFDNAWSIECSWKKN